MFSINASGIAAPARLLHLCGALALTCAPICAEAAHAAGMMRVEVEVYKGPVGQSLEIQIGQQAALLAGAVTTLAGLELSVDKMIKPNTCTGGVDAINCNYLVAAKLAARDSRNAICDVNEFSVLRLFQNDATIIDYKNQYRNLNDKIHNFGFDSGLNNQIAVDKITAIDSAIEHYNTEITNLSKDLQHKISEKISEQKILDKLLLSSPSKFSKSEADFKNKKIKNLNEKISIVSEQIADIENNIQQYRDSVEKEQVSQKELSVLLADMNLLQAPIIMQSCANAAKYLAESGYKSDAQTVQPENVVEQYFKADAASAQTPAGAVKNLTRQLATAAALMQVKAYSLTNSLIGVVPGDQIVRNHVMAIAYTLAEFSNQISARNNVLSKFCQFESAGDCAVDRGQAAKFPTGDYLRDAGSTRFVDVFEWFNASLPGYHGGLRQADRSRAIKLLTEDFYWEKVNQVYASGTGEVAMAFVKDDIGNWDLKSFSNDPTELLAAYSNAARALISSAVTLASGGGPAALGAAQKLGMGQKLLGLANSVVSGEGIGAPSIGGLDIPALRARTRQRLDTAKALFDGRKTALETKLADQNKAVTEAETDLKSKLSARNGKETAVTDAREQRASCGDTGCAVADKALQEAYDAKDTADAEYAKASAALDEAKTKKGKVEATQATLADAAADSFERILDDYNQDLLTLQQVASNASASAPVAP